MGKKINESHGTHVNGSLEGTFHVGDLVGASGQALRAVLAPHDLAHCQNYLTCVTEIITWVSSISRGR